jgi:hypothetical protein
VRSGLRTMYIEMSNGHRRSIFVGDLFFSSFLCR